MKVTAYVSVQFSMSVKVDEKYQNLLDADWASEHVAEDADLCDNLYHDLMNKINAIFADKNSLVTNIDLDAVWDESDTDLIFEN